MKTFDPPSVNTDEAPLDASKEGAGADADSQEDSGALFTAKLPAARRTAILSLVPGLGQLRNGETAKGVLFLSITLANVALVAALAAANLLKPILASAALALHRQPNWELGGPLQSGLIGSPALWLYALLAMTFVAYAVRDAYDGAVYLIKSGEQRLPRARLTLSEATSGSYLLHLTMMVVFLLAVILFITPEPRPTQVTQIELEREKPQEAKPAPKHHTVKQKEPAKVRPKPIVHPKPQVVQKPVVHKPVAVTPPKPTPVAVAIPTKEPTPLQLAPVETAPPAPEAAAPAPSGSSSGAGSQTGTGAGGTGDADVDMGPYMRDLQKRIKAHWYPPKGNENKRIKVSFKIFKDGHITNLKLIVSSGVGMADDAALTGVQEAAPFAHLPAGVGDDIDINFTFDYHVFGGKSL